MPGSRQREKVREVKNEVKGMLIIFFDIKNSSWQSKQSIPYITATFYGNCVDLFEDFTPNFGEK
jgi:hypothetical protein